MFDAPKLVDALCPQTDETLSATKRAMQAEAILRVGIENTGEGASDNGATALRKLYGFDQGLTKASFKRRQSNAAESLGITPEWFCKRWQDYYIVGLAEELFRIIEEA